MFLEYFIFCEIILKLFLKLKIIFVGIVIVVCLKRDKNFRCKANGSYVRCKMISLRSTATDKQHASERFDSKSLEDSSTNYGIHRTELELKVFIIC